MKHQKDVRVGELTVLNLMDFQQLILEIFQLQIFTNTPLKHLINIE